MCAENLLKENIIYRMTRSTTESTSQINLYEIWLPQNTTHRNQSSPCNLTGRIEAVYIACVEISFCCIILCQNAVTIAAVYRTPALHTNQYIILVSLGLVDILLALTLGGNVCVYVSQLRSRQINMNLADTILFGIIFSSVTTGALHMGIIALGRYVRVAYPFLYIRYVLKERVFKVLLCAWMIGIVNAVVPVIFYRQDKYHIRCIYTHPPLEYFTANAVVILINIIIVVTCYSKIAHLAIKHNKSANARQLQTGCEKRDNTYRTYWTTLLKSIKFCVIMCGIYFVCTVPPFFTITLGFSRKIPDLFASTIHYTFSIHSVLNFFVTCRLNQSYRQALKKMFRDFKVCISQTFKEF